MDTNADQRSNVDRRLMIEEIPLGWATAYLDTSVHTCEVLAALIHQRTERMLQTPVEMARIYHAYWADAARHYAEAASDMMDVGNKMLAQSQKSLHR